MKKLFFTSVLLFIASMGFAQNSNTKQAFEKAKDTAPNPSWGVQRTEDLLKEIK